MKPAIPPSQRQLDYFLGSTHSFNIAEGAVSSGKTWAQILRWYEHIYSVPDNSLLLMSGKTAESLYDNVLRDLAAINPQDIVIYRQPLRVHVRSKSIEIACADANNEASWGRVQGKTVFGWLADEVTQYPESFVKMAQSRCRGDGQVWPKFWTCNPSHPAHFVMTDYIQNQAIDCESWHFTLDDNPILSKAYKDEIKGSYSGLYYDRFVLGKWVLAEGAVYPEFDLAKHQFYKEPPEHWQRVRGIDYGYTNPFVTLWGALDNDDRLWIYDEHYRSKALLEEHATAIKSRTEPIQWTVADHDAQDNAELRNLGVTSKNARKDVEVGIQRVAARLIVQPDGYPRLFVHQRCKNLLREFGLYRWAKAKDDRNEKEEPMKSNDHAMDALRYIVMECDKGRAKPGAVNVRSLGI